MRIFVRGDALEILVRSQLQGLRWPDQLQARSNVVGRVEVQGGVVGLQYPLVGREEDIVLARGNEDLRKYGQLHEICQRAARQECVFVMHPRMNRCDV